MANRITGGGEFQCSDNFPILRGKTKAENPKIMLLAFSAAFLTVFAYLAFALPSVTFITPTLQDNATTGSNWVFVNVTSSENLNQALLEWGNSSGFTNVSMVNVSGMTNWYKNMTVLADGTYNYTVWAQNVTGGWNQSARKRVTVDTTSSKGSIIISAIDIDGSTTSAVNLWNENFLRVGDDVDVPAYGLIRFNGTNQSAAINSIRNNITSAKLFVYVNNITGTPTDTIEMQSHYSFNDSWDTTQLGEVVPYNFTDYIFAYSLIQGAGRWYVFDITSQIKNETNYLYTINIAPTAVKVNGVIDEYRISSSKSGANAPYIKIEYDKQKYGNYTHYPTLSELNLTNNNLSLQGQYGVYILSSGSNIFWILDRDIGAGQPVTTAKYNAATDKPDFVNMIVVTIADTQSDVINPFNTYTGATDVVLLSSNIAPNSVRLSKSSQMRKYYRNTTNAGTVNLISEAYGVPFYFNNGTIIDLGRGWYNVGSETMFNHTSGYLIYKGVTYNITSSYLIDFEELYGNGSGSESFAEVMRENGFLYDSPVAYLSFWNWQNYNNDVKQGSMYLKGSGEYINFNDNDMAGQFVRANKTIQVIPQNTLQYFNYTFYANSSKGYLVLNVTLFAAVNEYIGMANISGTWTYNNGTQIALPDSLGVYEIKITRKWDYVDWIQNAYVTREWMEVAGKDSLVYPPSPSLVFNFTVKGNNQNNIGVGIYNTTKIYASAQIQINNQLDGLYNNLTMNGNGTYRINSLSVSLTSSANINVTVNTYNATVFNFTAANSTANQKMNITVSNGTFPMINGQSYTIAKNGMLQSTQTAASGQVVFTNISVGSEYIIQSAGCTESWSYSGWSACSGGIQTRTATDANGCGTTVNQLALSQSCSSGSSGSGSSSSASVDSSTGTLTNRFTSIVPNAPRIITESYLNGTGTNLKEIDIYVKNTVINPTVSVQNLDRRPSSVSVDAVSAAGKIYKYINISKNNMADADISNATIQFKVDKSWLAANNFSANNVVLKRFTTQWDSLNTTMTSSDNTYDYYESVTPGFSVFAVAADKGVATPVAPVQPTQPTTPEQPAAQQPPAQQDILPYIAVLAVIIITLAIV